MVLLDGALDFEDEDFFLDEDTSLMRGSSANSLQNGVVQRHALMFEDPGSDISLKLQSSSAVKGLLIGPNNTLVGKHSLKTARKYPKTNNNDYSVPKPNKKKSFKSFSVYYFYS